MDPVYVAVNLFHGFSNRKKAEIIENTLTLEILQKHPQTSLKLYFSPCIFHLGPC
jgi:hypothetical protein